jgi:hypothetical protein
MGKSYGEFLWVNLMGISYGAFLWGFQMGRRDGRTLAHSLKTAFSVYNGTVLQTSVSKRWDKSGQDVPLSLDKKKFLSRCPFVPGQGKEQMSRGKLLCPGTSRDKITPQKPGKSCSKTEKQRSETKKGHSKLRKEVLKQEKDFLKQKSMFQNRMMKKNQKKKIPFFYHYFFHFCPAGRPGTRQDRLSKSRPVPWQDFEFVPLSLCPGTRKEFLSFCPEKLNCPVLLNMKLTYCVIHK